MAVPSTIESLIDLCCRSELLDVKTCADYVAQARDAGRLPTAPAQFAKAMVADGLLTDFQTDCLLRGRWQNLVLEGKFVLLRLLGAGGMGKVFLGQHRTMRHLVAVKVLPASLAEGATGLKRFYREARASATLDHPNLVRAYDFGRAGRLHYLVMQYVDGVSLQELVARHGPLEIQRACHYVCQTAEGLQYVHEAGLVHRDVKPGNLLVDRSGTVKLLDLGLARFFDDKSDNLTRIHSPSMPIGTADYIAPELARADPTADIRVDLYSLGVTFYFLLTGKVPFGGRSVAQKLVSHQRDIPRPVTELRPEVPAELAAVIERMMAKNPTERFQTPGEVAAALEPWVSAPIDPPLAAEFPEPCPASQEAGQRDHGRGRGRLSSGELSPKSGGGRAVALARPRKAPATVTVDIPGPLSMTPMPRKSLSSLRSVVPTQPTPAVAGRLGTRWRVAAAVTGTLAVLTLVAALALCI